MGYDTIGFGSWLKVPGQTCHIRPVLKIEGLRVCMSSTENGRISSARPKLLPKIIPLGYPLILNKSKFKITQTINPFKPSQSILNLPLSTLTYPHNIQSMQYYYIGCGLRWFYGRSAVVWGGLQWFVVV